MKKFLVILLLLHGIRSYGQDTIMLETATGVISGTLLLPGKNLPSPIALIIAGSGPTDRDGNNPVMKNNSLKMLAEGLQMNGIASVRYDKRGVGQSIGAGVKESDLRFENYIEDARAWIDLLARDERFNEIIVIGHSEGSLIGMIASQSAKVGKFISIAGVGSPADQILRRQLSAQQPIVLEKSVPIMDELLKGNLVDSIPPWLNSLFRPSVQPYLISWFKYDPSKELAKLTIPVLLLQGTTDIQVIVEDARKLSAANSRAELVIIEGMNHILKEAPSDRTQNIQTYSQPDLALKEGLIGHLVRFIK